MFVLSQVVARNPRIQEIIQEEAEKQSAQQRQTIQQQNLSNQAPLNPATVKNTQIHDQITIIFKNSTNF